MFSHKRLTIDQLLPKELREVFGMVSIGALSMIMPWTWDYSEMKNISQENAEPGVVADRSRLQEGYRSMGRGEGEFQGARKRAGS